MGNLLEYMKGNACKDVKNHYRRTARVMDPIVVEGYIDDDKKKDGDSSEPKTPEERQPMKTLDDDEDETDEDQMKEETKES